MRTLTRVFEFDAAHRIMNEKVKCFNLHGHRFKVEVTFSYEEQGELGYAVDFKDIKTVIGKWIDEKLDHACILNPDDTDVIELCRKNEWRHYVMGFGMYENINPTAENLASELFYTIGVISKNSFKSVTVQSIRLYETQNCWVETDGYDYEAPEVYKHSLTEWFK